MRNIFLIPLLLALLCGCASHHAAVGRTEYLPTGTNLAVNLGVERYGDLCRLRDGLIAAGFRCGERAMSLNAAPILVLPEDFGKAQTLAKRIIIRDSLTVRLWKSPGSAELEVWEHGRKSRDESYKIY
jgi:hypothetical protein